MIHKLDSVLLASCDLKVSVPSMLMLQHILFGNCNMFLYCTVLFSKILWTDGQKCLISHLISHSSLRKICVEN